MTSKSVDAAQSRAEISSGIYASRLRRFVEKWAPRQSYERDSFQQDLMMLFADAMRSQADYLSLGIETYASTLWREQALRPLQVIFDEKGPK